MTDPAAPSPIPASTPQAASGVLSAHSVNYRALTNPITRAQVRDFRIQTKVAQRADPNLSTALGTGLSITSIIAIVICGVIFVPIVLFMLGGALTVGVDGDPTAGGSTIVTAIVVVLGLAAVITIAVRHFTYGEWSLWMRLTEFAADNGLRFRTRNGNPSYQGMIFQLGDSRFVFNHLNSTTGRFYDFGGFQYVTGSGKSRQTHRWGFIALQLDRQLPNMVLDSRQNNGLFGMSDLPISFNKDQILSLEGDFNEHFTLYCPKEYETDALYVFTPDLMALLIDDANSFDVEIVDDWMFVYSRTVFDLTNQAVMARLFSIIGTVGSKTITQTENYHDDRVGSPSANIVAPQGQRLRHGFSLAAIIGVVVIVGFWMLGTASNFLR